MTTAIQAFLLLYMEKYFENIWINFPAESIPCYHCSSRKEQKISENCLCCQSNVF